MYIREFKNEGFESCGWELMGYKKEFLGIVKNIDMIVIGLGSTFLFDDMLFNVVNVEKLEGETHYHLDEVRPAPIKLEV